MTPEEFKQYEYSMTAWHGKFSTLPPLWFREIGGRPLTGMGWPWTLPLNVEINVVSIVMAGYDCGWTPLKAEPFTKRMWLKVQQDLRGYSSTVSTAAGDGYLPHTAEPGTCYAGEPHSKLISGESDLKAFEDCMAMISAEINLGSLLSPWNTWDTRIFRFIPPDLHQVMRDYWRFGKPASVSMARRMAETADLHGSKLNNLTWSRYE